MHEVVLPLSEPPLVADTGVGVHGVTTLEDVFLLPDLWQLHLYSYEGAVEVGGVVHRIAPGRASLIPPGTEVRYRYRGRSEHLYAHLRLDGTTEHRAAPVMQDAGPHRPLITGLMRAALAAAPARAAAHLWTVLWQLTDAGPAGREVATDPFAVAAAHIEANLAGPLSVAGVAKVAGVSHNHLTRLFRARTGTTVVAYIRRRRVERARHLLTASTLSVTPSRRPSGSRTCRRSTRCAVGSWGSRRVGCGGGSRHGDAVLLQCAAERAQTVVQTGLHGVVRHAQRVGELVDGLAVVVGPGDHLAVFGGELCEGVRDEPRGGVVHSGLLSGKADDAAAQAGRVDLCGSGQAGPGVSPVSRSCTPFRSR